jgi:hypothetical protein
MIYIEQNATNNIFVNVSQYKTGDFGANPRYLWRLQNAQGRNIVSFYPENATSTYPSMYANRYDVFSFDTFKSLPENLNYTGGTPCNLHLENENQYWLGVYEMPSGSTSYNPSSAKLLNSLAFIFVPVNNEFYTGNTANVEPNKIYYKNGDGITPTPSNTASPTPTPSITPSITPTSTLTPTPTKTETPTPTPTITATSTLTPTPSITPSITPTSTLTPTPTITPSASPLPPIDPDALAYMNRVIAVGGTLDATMSAATITLVDDLKSAGIWNTLDIFLPVLGGTADADKINLVEPTNATYDWTYYGSVYHDVSGMTTNGSAGAVIPTWNTNDLVKSTYQSSFFMIYRNRTTQPFAINGFINTSPGYDYCSLGSYYNTSYNGLYSDYTFGNNPSGTNYPGSLAINRDSSAGNGATLYYNNTSWGVDTNNAIAPYPPYSYNSIAILALYWGNQGLTQNIYTEFGDDRVSTWSIGSELTNTERTDMYNAVINFNTTLGRNI